MIACQMRELLNINAATHIFKVREIVCAVLKSIGSAVSHVVLLKCDKIRERKGKEKKMLEQ